MKLKFVENWDDKVKKGHEVEVDKIRYNPEATGCYSVRVVSLWKRPQWLAIAWFLKVPGDDYSELEHNK